MAFSSPAGCLICVGIAPTTSSRASQQLEAHWLLWLGVLATVAIAVWGVVGHERVPGYAGYILVAASGLLYASVAVWHFIEHANGVDPEVAHVLLAIGQAGMVLGAIIATVIACKGHRRAAGEPGPATG